jgi:hypothetical protein
VLWPAAETLQVLERYEAGEVVHAFRKGQKANGVDPDLSYDEDVETLRPRTWGPLAFGSWPPPQLFSTTSKQAFAPATSTPPKKHK